VKFSLAGLTANWRLKGAALGLALLLWAVISAEQVTTQWVPARVEVTVADPEYVLTGGPDPPEVQVRFTGPGRELWDLALDRPTLLLRVQNVGERRVFALDPRMVQVRGGLSVSAVDVRPPSVRLELQQLVSREVPVQPRIGPGSQARYVLQDEMEVIPTTVRISGPADRVQAIDSVRTVVFEVVPDDTIFGREVALDTAGLGGLSLSRERVSVRGRVDRRVERGLSDVPVAAPPGLAVRPRQVEVRLSGPERLVRAVFPAALRVTVQRDSIPAEVPLAGVEVPLVVEGLPSGVSARTNPARALVGPAVVEPAAPETAAPVPPQPSQPPPAPPPADDGEP
jgi:YbbR domain-containing protein